MAKSSMRRSKVRELFHGIRRGVDCIVCGKKRGVRTRTISTISTQVRNISYDIVGSLIFNNFSVKWVS